MRGQCFLLVRIACLVGVLGLVRPADSFPTDPSGLAGSSRVHAGGAERLLAQSTAPTAAEGQQGESATKRATQSPQIVTSFPELARGRGNSAETLGRAAGTPGDLEQQARILFDEERYGEAADRLRQVLASQPGSISANVLLSFALARAGAMAAAVEQTRRALDREPNNVRLRLLLAGLLELQDATRGEAVQHYQRVLEQDPGNGLARLGLGEINRSQGRTFEALNEFTRLAQENPNDARYEIRLGQLYGALGDLDKARRHFERAHALDPSSVDALRSLAILADVDDRPRDALGFYRELAALYPNDVSVQIAIGAMEGRRDEPAFPVSLDQMEKTTLETYLKALPENSSQLVHRQEQLEATKRRALARWAPTFYLNPSFTTVTRTPKPSLTDHGESVGFSLGWNLADLLVNPYAINITGMQADYEAIRTSLMGDVSASYYQRLQGILEYRRLQRVLALNPQDAQARQQKQNVKYNILHLTERLKILTGLQ